MSAGSGAVSQETSDVSDNARGTSTGSREASEGPDETSNNSRETSRETGVLSDETRGTSKGWRKTSEESREVSEERPKRPKGIEGKLETEEVDMKDSSRPEPDKLGDRCEGEPKDIEDNRDMLEGAEDEGETIEAIDKAACNGGFGDCRSRSEV